MKIFYFVGGPKAGRAEDFFQRLHQIGGSPAGWRIYPHSSEDGKALHVVEAESRQAILDHLQQFGDTYEHTEIIEIRDARQ